MAMEIAKQVRINIKIEYKKYNLKKIKDLYEKNNYFNDYLGAIHDVIAAIIGRLIKLKSVFIDLYNYTSDDSGVRHSAKIGGVDSTFEEAKFMLVAYSAFKNYLLSNSK